MNVWLFGPPAIGKSTIVARLLAQGVQGFDFEWLWTSNSLNWNRNNLGRIVSAMRDADQVQGGRLMAVYGAAGLSPMLDYPGLKVLLYLEEKDYQTRLHARNLLRPYKASQSSPTMSEWMDLIHWDELVLANSHAEERIHTLLRRETK